MIALTQEKREELIACANEIKKMATSTHGYKVGNDAFGSNALMLMEVALASLTAESIAHADSKAILKMIKGHSRFFTSFPERSETKRVGLFTAPPVPEIKLPHELMDLVKSVEFYHSVKAENPDTETGMWRDAYDWIKKAAVEAAPVIKRLNGLGE
ncbi:hypothetical protein [Rosenbergiella epipactidis]|uniref:hypothetical protein n=1 Tax=Rosenbergiella epipactidis TaxID=1544694 RepID=UPI001F4E3D2F|nr:hypothetical protein [Rosenbergiella epipactidis]